jgi:hypothetical protein
LCCAATPFPVISFGEVGKFEVDRECFRHSVRLVHTQPTDDFFGSFNQSTLRIDILCRSRAGKRFTMFYQQETEFFDR